MNNKNRKSAAVLFVCAAFLLAGAQCRAAVEETAPLEESDALPTWGMAAPDTISNLQALLGTDAGVGLLAQIPSLAAIKNLDASSINSRDAVGALADHLPKNFDDVVETALKKKDASKLAELAGKVADAHEQAAPEVAFILQLYAENQAISVVRRETKLEDLAKIQDTLKPFDLYGAIVTRNPKVVGLKKAVQDAWQAQSMLKARELVQPILAGGSFINISTEDGMRPVRVSNPKYSRQAVIAAAQSYAKDAKAAPAPADISTIPGDVASAPIDAKTSAASSGGKNKEILVRFKETTAVRVVNKDGTGFDMETRVTKDDIEDKLESLGLTAVSSKDGLYRVAVKTGGSLDEAIAALQKESIVLFATPRTARAPKSKQIFLQFKDTVIVDFGGLTVEAAVREDDIAKLLRKHGLQVLEIKNGVYHVAVTGKQSAREVVKALALQEKIIRSARTAVL